MGMVATFQDAGNHQNIPSKHLTLPTLPAEIPYFMRVPRRLAGQTSSHYNPTLSYALLIPQKHSGISYSCLKTLKAKLSNRVGMSHSVGGEVF